jgi:hypothetical protein
MEGWRSVSRPPPRPCSMSSSMADGRTSLAGEWQFAPLPLLAPTWATWSAVGVVPPPAPAAASRPSPSIVERLKRSPSRSSALVDNFYSADGLRHDTKRPVDQSTCPPPPPSNAAISNRPRGGATSFRVTLISIGCNQRLSSVHPSAQQRRGISVTAVHCVL